VLWRGVLITWPCFCPSWVRSVLRFSPVAVHGFVFKSLDVTGSCFVSPPPRRIRSWSFSYLTSFSLAIRSDFSSSPFKLSRNLFQGPTPFFLSSSGRTTFHFDGAVLPPPLGQQGICFRVTHRLSRRFVRHPSLLSALEGTTRLLGSNGYVCVSFSSFPYLLRVRCFPPFFLRFRRWKACVAVCSPTGPLRLSVLFCFRPTESQFLFFLVIPLAVPTQP